ncbi:MAG: TIGR00296 family protein [archaeon]
MIQLSDGKTLVKSAREAILTYFSGKNLKIDIDKFSELQGVFVTLTKYKRLRGCIGFPEPVYALKRGIIEAARAAAFEDPRFPAITQSEFDDVCVEVSVLTKPDLMIVGRPEEYLDKIEIGKHGLIIRDTYHSGLLLPQVFTDYNSTPKEALEMTCEKAGLSKDAWKNKGTKIYSFSAQIFKEEEPNGNIVEE